jgi:ABC-2 type transport system ATP-binding protein
VDEIPGKNRRIVSVQYAEKGNLIEKYGLRAIDPQVTYTGDQHVFAITARLDEALQAISAHPIADISIRKPSLEELFMDYYHVPGGEAR